MLVRPTDIDSNIDLAKLAMAKVCKELGYICNLVGAQTMWMVKCDNEEKRALIDLAKDEVELMKSGKL